MNQDLSTRQIIAQQTQQTTDVQLEIYRKYNNTGNIYHGGWLKETFFKPIYEGKSISTRVRKESAFVFLIYSCFVFDIVSF